MGQALIQLKIMPESPDTNLDIIKKSGEEKVKQEEGDVKFEEQDIAFGLKALIASLKIDEEKGTDKAEEIFNNIEGVSSVEIIDYRRALG